MKKINTVLSNVSNVIQSTMYPGGSEMPTTTTVEPHSVFLVDDTLSDIQKVKRYSLSQLPLQRLVYVKRITSCARGAGMNETITHILPLLPKLVQDKESAVRQALGQELGLLASFLAYPNVPPPPHPEEKTDYKMPDLKTIKKDEKGLQQIKEAVIPILNKLIVDPSAEVRQSASESLVKVASVLDEDDVGKIVLTMVLCLAHDESDEQRTTAVGILNELAPLLGSDLCKNFVTHELIAFADDPIFRVRKAAAQNFGNVCVTAGPDIAVQKLLPAFVKLSNDAIWGVRKGCVESLVAVAKVAPPEVRASIFIPMFERFAKDVSRWVRNGAFEILGPFLHTLGSKLVTKELLRHYTQIPEMSNSVVDAEVTFFCAFNLPAVALTLGPERWDELADCFDRLIKDSKFHVRKTLSCSLFELAQILGTKLTEKHLLPALDIFLKDLDEVRYGAIKSLSKILKVLSPAKREQYLETLWDVHNQSENWRWRQLLAEQMGDFALLFSAEITGNSILPMTLSLCKDSVAAVRTVAVKAVGILLNRLAASNKASYEECVKGITAFQKSRTYIERQLFIRMCESMLNTLPQEIFENEFLPLLVQLGEDLVPNVKLTLAQFVTQLHRHPHFSKKQSTLGLFSKLTADKDKDVVRFCQIDNLTVRSEAEVQKEYEDMMGLIPEIQQRREEEKKKRDDEEKKKLEEKKLEEKKKEEEKKESSNVISSIIITPAKAVISETKDVEKKEEKEEKKEVKEVKEVKEGKEKVEEDEGVKVAKQLGRRLSKGDVVHVEEVAVDEIEMDLFPDQSDPIIVVTSENDLKQMDTKINEATTTQSDSNSTTPTSPSSSTMTIIVDSKDDKVLKEEEAKELEKKRILEEVEVPRDNAPEEERKRLEKEEAQASALAGPFYQSPREKEKKKKMKLREHENEASQDSLSPPTFTFVAATNSSSTSTSTSTSTSDNSSYVTTETNIPIDIPVIHPHTIHPLPPNSSFASASTAALSSHRHSHRSDRLHSPSSLSPVVSPTTSPSISPALPPSASSVTPLNLSLSLSSSTPTSPLSSSLSVSVPASNSMINSNSNPTPEKTT